MNILPKTLVALLLVSLAFSPGAASAQETNYPGAVTPTLFCLGSCGVETISPTQQAVNPTAASSPVANANPATTTSPADVPCASGDTVSTQTYKGKHKKKEDGAIGGFLRQFFQFLIKLIELFLQFPGGGSKPPIGNPIMPSTVPNPTDPQTTPLLTPPASTVVPTLQPCTPSPTTASTTGNPTQSPPQPSGMATYYVSPAGNDSNPGTLEQPFATITKARDVVRTKNQAMTGDINVYVRAGTYRLTSPFELGTQDSGKGNFNIKYMAYPGERPVISGGIPVTGWTTADSAKNIWKATVGTTFQTRGLYVNGVKAQRARSPEKQIQFTKSGSGFTTSLTAMQTWKNLTEVELVGHNMQKFYTCRIKSMSGGTITITQPCWDNSQLSEPSFDGVNWVENAYELLDTEGEWYLDRPAGTIYYKPRSGESLTSAIVIAAGIESVVKGGNVTNVQFSGLTFAYSGWNFPSSDVGYVGLQQGQHPPAKWDGEDGELMIPASVIFLKSKNIKFEKNIFTNLGGVGIAFDDGSQAITVQGNRFENIANNAINLGDAFHNHPEPADEDRNMTIANNYITKIGNEYPNSAGIWGGYVADIKILHNEVFNVPQKGIAVGWGWGATSYASNNKISYNYIHDFTNLLEDSGGVYTLSPQTGTEVSYNHIDHDINGYNCLYPDEGSAHMNWHHNVCKRVGEWLHIWTSSIHDNTVQNNYSDISKMENEGVNNTVSNNTVVTNGQWPAEAQTIMNNAGIEANYRDIKTIPLIPQ